LFRSSVPRRGGVKVARAERQESQPTNNADRQTVRQGVQHQPPTGGETLPMVGQTIERLTEARRSSVEQAQPP